MSRQHIVPFIPITALLLGMAFVTSARAADTCDALYNAGIKAVQMPHHVYTTKTAPRGGKILQSSEAIFTGGVEYLRVGGQWRRSARPQGVMLEAAREKLKTHPDTCTDARDETVDGQAVTTYKVHDRESGTDSLVHILKSTGLLLGETLTLPDGSLVKTRYEYTNVHPPPGVP